MEPFDHWSTLRNLSGVPSLSSYHDLVLSEFSGSKYSKGKGRKPSPWRYPFHFRYCWRNGANSTQEYFFPVRTRSRLLNCNFLEGRYQEVLSFHLFPAQLAIVSSWNVSLRSSLSSWQGGKHTSEPLERRGEKSRERHASLLLLASEPLLKPCVLQTTQFPKRSRLSNLIRSTAVSCSSCASYSISFQVVYLCQLMPASWYLMMCWNAKEWIVSDLGSAYQAMSTKLVSPGSHA